MSNPAVTKLAELTIGSSKIWFDDNIGESIHFHLGDFRLDFTIDEFRGLSEQLYLVLEEMYPIPGLDLRKLSPNYLQQVIEYFPKLMKVEMDEVFLEDLQVSKEASMGTPRTVSLVHSRGVRALRGDTRENDKPRESHHVNQTSAQRLDNVMRLIRENGYPFDDKYVMLFNDELVIRDGQHRASCLYYLYGNIKIPVMRFIFDGTWWENPSRFMILNFLRTLKRINYSKIRRYCKRIYHMVRSFWWKIKWKLFMMMNKKLSKKMKEIYWN